MELKEKITLDMLTKDSVSVLMVNRDCNFYTDIIFNS